MRNKRIRPTRSSRSNTSSLMGRDLFTADISFGSSTFGTSSSSTEPALQDDRWEEDTSGINSDPILVHGGVEVRGGELVYHENAGRSVQVAGPAMGEFGEEDNGSAKQIVGGREPHPFIEEEGTVYTFLDLPYEHKIPSSVAGLNNSWRDAEGAVHAAAEEIRELARAYYTNYDDLKRRQADLPEAGVRILINGKGEFTYYFIIVGDLRPEKATTRFERYEGEYDRLAARLHFHWSNLIPSEGADLSVDPAVGEAIKLKGGSGYQAWVASYDSQKPYFVWRREGANQ